MPKGGRLDAAFTTCPGMDVAERQAATNDAKDWRAFAGPAVVYLASAAPPAPLGRLLRMRASPSKGGLKSAAKGALRKAALSLVAALLLLLGSLVARPEKRSVLCARRNSPRAASSLSRCGGLYRGRA